MTQEKEIQKLVERIDQLEQRNNDRFKAVHKIIKGIQMAEMNFDDLLDELDFDIEVPKEKEAKVEEVVTPEPEPTPEPVDDLDALLESEEIFEVETEVNNVEEIKNQLAEAKREVSQLRKDLKAQEKAQVQAEATVAVVSELDNPGAVKEFLNDLDALEAVKKTAQEDIAQLKSDAKVQGVEVNWVIKARKEVIKELKESTEEAEMVEQAKKLIYGDETLMDSVYAELPEN